MNNSHWYRVPEVWLILCLLGSTIIGSLYLVALAGRTPDRHIEAPRHGALPPEQKP